MLDHDILIIGAGMAGMRAALSAKEQGADVAVVSKVHPVRSHSNAAQGGINAALTDRGDDWRDHAYDTIKGSDFLGDQDLLIFLFLFIFYLFHNPPAYFKLAFFD
mgnify:CR=1 FL=1